MARMDELKAFKARHTRAKALRLSCASSEVNDVVRTVGFRR